MDGHMMEIDTAYLSKLDCIIDGVFDSGGTQVTIAGGAIRDMLFNKPIKDIDVFYVGELETSALKEQFDTVVECDIKYEGSSFTVTHEVKHLLIPVWCQLIKIDGDVMKYINEFPTPIGRVAYSMEGLKNLTWDVLYAHKDKVIIFDRPTNLKYYNKLSTKYHDYKLSFMHSAHKPPEPLLECLNF